METEISRPGRSRGTLLRSVLGAMLLATGCASGPAPAPVNLGGFSQAFKQGYSEGCDSAGALHPRRDEFRYRKDSEYRQGWDDGYSACGRSPRVFNP